MVQRAQRSTCFTKREQMNYQNKREVRRSRSTNNQHSCQFEMLCSPRAGDSSAPTAVTAYVRAVNGLSQRQQLGVGGGACNICCVFLHVFIKLCPLPAPHFYPLWGLLALCHPPPMWGPLASLLVRLRARDAWPGVPTAFQLAAPSGPRFSWPPSSEPEYS